MSAYDVNTGIDATDVTITAAVKNAVNFFNIVFSPLLQIDPISLLNLFIHYKL